MAQVGAQPEHRVVDGLTRLAPALQAPHRHGVSQIVDPGIGMVATGAPAESWLQAPEDVLYRARGQIPTIVRDEERGAVLGALASVSCLPVQLEFPHGARMKRQAAGLVELGLAHGERGGLRVDVAQREPQRFGQPEAGRCDQPEQAAVGQRSKRPGQGQSASSVEQLDDLLVRVNVRRQAPMTTTKDALRGNLRGRLELPVVRGEWKHDLQPACCSHVAGSMHMLPCPTQHQLLREWASVFSCVGVPGKSRELGGGCRQRKAQAAAILEIALHCGLHRCCRTHGRLPGQGMATAPSRPKSTLA